MMIRSVEKNDVSLAKLAKLSIVDNDYQFDINAAIAASLEISTECDRDNNDPNVSQRVTSNVMWRNPNAPPFITSSTPPTTRCENAAIGIMHTHMVFAFALTVLSPK